MATSPEQKFDVIKTGAPAESLVKRLLRHHPDINTFHIFSYDLNVDSSDSLQAVGMRPMRRKDIQFSGLRRASKNIQRRIPWIDGERNEYDSRIGMAFASLVYRHDGTPSHIPQLDFNSRVYQPDLNITQISKTLKPYPGYILETGNSLHYWGTDLLSPQRWFDFLTYASKNFSSETLDIAFIDFSKRRGFSGLRIYAYEDIKPVIPYVIARV